MAKLIYSKYLWGTLDDAVIVQTDDGHYLVQRAASVDKRGRYRGSDYPVKIFDTLAEARAYFNEAFCLTAKQEKK